jgi:hypothetical protein
VKHAVNALHCGLHRLLIGNIPVVELDTLAFQTLTL